MGDIPYDLMMQRARVLPPEGRVDILLKARIRAYMVGASEHDFELVDAVTVAHVSVVIG